MGWPVAGWPQALAGLIQLVLFLTFSSGLPMLFTFPDGRFAPGWTRWLVVPWLALEAGAYFLPDTSLNFSNWPALACSSSSTGWTSACGTCTRWSPVPN